MKAGREQEMRPPRHQDLRDLDLDSQERGSSGWGRQTHNHQSVWLSGAAAVKGQKCQLASSGAAGKRPSGAARPEETEGGNPPRGCGGFPTIPPRLHLHASRPMQNGETVILYPQLHLCPLSSTDRKQLARNSVPSSNHRTLGFGSCK